MIVSYYCTCGHAEQPDAFVNHKYIINDSDFFAVRHTLTEIAYLLVPIFRFTIHKLHLPAGVSIPCLLYTSDAADE